MGDLVINKKNGIIELFNTAPFCTVTKAELSRSILSDDYIDITVESSEKLDLNLEDRIIVEGRSYFVNLLPQVKKNAEDSFTYDIRFFGASSILRRNILFNRDSQGGKTGFEFPMTAELNAFLYLIINNANEFENNWVLGDFPVNTTTKTISFQKENCLAALQRVCQEFNVEFEVEETGGKFVLHIREKIGKLLPFKVEYGMGNGLYDLTRARSNDSEVVTILYGYGSSENIPVKYRGYSPRLRMPIAIGDYITNQVAQELFGKVVGVFDPDIKPEFKGIVSGVGSLTNGLQEISVSNMDFDLKEKESDGKTTKYLIAGTPAKISVTKGDLAGYDFEVVDYIHSTKTFKLKQFADDRGQKFPDNTTVFKFAAGDEFTLIDIMMPEQYITNAEQKLYDETVKEYQKVSQNNVKYTLNVDPLFLQDKGEIGIGDLLPIKDADFGIDKASRIISLKKDLLTDTYTSFDVADSYEISLVKEIVNNIKDLQKEIASQKVINRQSYLDGYRRVEDRFSMYFDADGKMDGSHIKADTIDVGMLSSGSKSRWFQLEEVVFTPNLGSDPNSFRATAGRLVHFGIKTSSGTERVWNLSALTVNNLLNQGYYVYAKCDINGDYGTFIITPDRIVFDSQPNYYHFLIGNLYTASSGGRAFDANYGVSQMNGRMIFAGVISDIQGRPMIDLDKREIIGKVTFTNDSPALGQVQEKIDAVQVGSVNLLDNSAVFAMSANDVGLGTSVLIENESEKFYRATPDNGKRVSLYGLWYTLESNQEYVRGIYVRHSASVAQDVRVFNHNSNIGGEKIVTIQPNTWTFIKTNTIIGSGGNTALIIEMFTPNIPLDYKKTMLVKGNRIGNDWTPSANDVNSEITVAKQNAANAQNTANTAVDNAAIANQRLADIANDNKLTPEEKSDTIKEWDIIADEYIKLIPQANTYGVDTNAYTGAKNALSSYLINISYNNLNTTSDINGTEFRQKFRDYYDAKVSLLKAISDATKNYANGLVSNIKIGGINKVLGSNKQITSGAMLFNVSNIGEIIGNDITISIFLEGYNLSGQSNRIGAELYIKFNDGTEQWFGVWFYSNSSSTWIENTRKSESFKVKNVPISSYQFGMYVQANGDYIRVKQPQLEIGNKAGSYSVAPEDIQDQVNKAQGDANIANQKLANIANDNLLTTSEKPEVIKEWQVIDAEFPHIRSQATTFGVNYDNFSYFYQQLSTYLISIEYANLTKDNAINGAEFRQKFVLYYTERTDLLKRISDASKNYTNSTTEAAKIEMAMDARNKALAASYASGKCLYRDVDFRSGLNGIQVYNNTGSASVNLFLYGSAGYGAPTKSPNIAVIQYNGDTNVTPGIGGFYFSTPTRANAIYVVRFIAKIPVNYAINFHTNAIGDDAKVTWTTSQQGTGKWEEYIVIIRCGSYGVFNSTAFFALDTSLVTNVMEWYLCYASVFDLTDVDKYLEDKIKQNEQQTALAKAQADNALATANIASQKLSFLSTTIDNNLVATGTLMVGDVAGANAGITGVTDRGRQSVRLYAGSTYAGKNTAPWYVDDYGVEYQYLNGVMIRRRGVINGNYVDELYNISGQLAKKTAIVSGKILEEWYNNGQLVYQIGENGIYFVREVPESYTEYRMLKLIDGIGPNPTQQQKDDLSDYILNRTCGVNPIPASGKFERYNIYGDRLLFLYNAGQNVNSQSNKQFEGYKTSQNKYENAPDGWYIPEALGWGFPGDVFLVEVIYLSNGAQIKNMALQRDVSGRIFMECSY
ncbi:hypothetical protein KRE43_12870 [Elizabethkingia meningoseptica]|uniref:hypothetical protein n=1 Tax=Elizabethkingia meningoseptica TaxID=238 RepID=UPI0023B0F5F2|nr:hypothetical protein [Elizabethkingia meningoseptica]MDE5530429.1 hypothetical protein [Elizabethkingia meningoseptica]MDE5533986.1 hypothetical protein [Elizabethkingia meningoseptica]MDE5542738.1 hypothetical protein [Elizabethkingia meningoseptica]